MSRWNTEAHPWQQAAPRVVIITFDFTQHHPPSPAFTGAAWNATQTELRVGDRVVGRVVSPLTALDAEHGEALAIVQLTDNELETFFPNGYIIDPL